MGTETKVERRQHAAVAAHRLPNDRWRPLEVVLWLLPVLAFFVFPYSHLLGSQILILALFALSVDLVVGYAGIITLGHGVFFGFGAYTAALLVLNGWGEPITGILAGGVIGAIGGFLASFLFVRGGHLTQILITLGFVLMVHEAANKAAFITGGADGLPGIVVWKLLGIFEFDLAGSTGYVYALVVLFLIFVFTRRLTSAPFGLALRGLREGPKRMPAIGVPVLRRQVTIFTISAGIAGVAGALLAQTTQYVGLDTIGFVRSADVLVVLALGGTGRLYGAIIGAAVYLIVQDYLFLINPVYWQFWIGLLLVVLVIFARGGLLGGAATLYARLSKRRSR